MSFLYADQFRTSGRVCPSSHWVPERATRDGVRGRKCGNCGVAGLCVQLNGATKTRCRAPWARRNMVILPDWWNASILRTIVSCPQGLESCKAQLQIEGREISALFICYVHVTMAMDVYLDFWSLLLLLRLCHLSQPASTRSSLTTRSLRRKNLATEVSKTQSSQPERRR